MKKIGLLLLILAFVKIGMAQTSAKRTLFDDANFVIEPLNSINTIGSDISPVLIDGEIYFASVREEYFNRPALEQKNKAFYDIYSAKLDEKGIISSDRKLVPGFGEKYHEGPVCFCQVTGELFTTLSNTIHPDTIHKMFPIENIRLRLVIRKKVDGLWKTLEELPFNNDKYNFAHPAISATGDTLIFSSDMDSESYGKSDLFMSVRTNGKWSNPKNLGEKINTKGNEMFPVFLPGGLLSFASDGQAGTQGGLDIWYTTFPNSGEIKNAGNVINSTFDDFGLVISPDKNVGYFSSNRPGKGSDDIYSIQIKRLYEILRGKVVDDQTGVPVANSTVQLFDCNGQVISTTMSDSQGNFQLEVVKVNCSVLEATKEGYEKDRKDISGLDYAELRIRQKSLILTVKIIDKETAVNLENAKFEILSGEYDHSMLKNENGVIQLQINPSVNYIFYASSEGYLPKEIKYSPEGKDQSEYSLIIPIEKLAAGKQFVLENLYYDLNKYNIRPDAALVLDRLIKILVENPKIRIEIGSHTDCRASTAYNQKLSQNRSESVVAYLVSKGISAKRVVAKGYGETQLVNKCADGVLCTEEEHQANRRTVVRILDMGAK